MTRVAAVLATLVAAVPAFAEDRAPIGLVVALRGDGSITRGDARTPLSEGATLQVGDVVRTAARASASVRLSDGSLLVLGAETEIRLTRALVDDRGNAVEMGVLLRVGRVLATVTGWSGFERGVEVLTPTSRVRVRRATIEIVVDERGETTVRVIDGEADVEGETIRPGGGPEAPTSTAPASEGATARGSRVESHEAEILASRAIGAPTTSSALETAIGALDLDRAVGAAMRLLGGTLGALPTGALAPALPTLEADGPVSGIRGTVTFR